MAVNTLRVNCYSSAVSLYSIFLFFFYLTLSLSRRYSTVLKIFFGKIYFVNILQLYFIGIIIVKYLQVKVKEYIFNFSIFSIFDYTLINTFRLIGTHVLNIVFKHSFHEKALQ